MGSVAAIGGGALLGGAAGSQPERGLQTSRVLLDPANKLENQGFDISREQLTSLEDLIGLGPGGEDVTAGVEQQRSFAELLQSALDSSGLPTSEDIGVSRSFASDIFAPERQAIISGFDEQNQRVSQLAAQLGRPVNDPILQAKLAQEQTRQLGGLEARQTAFAAEQARQLPFQRIQLGQALTNVRSGLASQAFANRQALFELGQSALANERQFRLQTATRDTATQQGGGFRGFATGALAGAGAGIGGASKLGLLGTGGNV